MLVYFFILFLLCIVIVNVEAQLVWQRVFL